MGIFGNTGRGSLPQRQLPDYQWAEQKRFQNELAGMQAAQKERRNVLDNTAKGAGALYDRVGAPAFHKGQGMFGALGPGGGGAPASTTGPTSASTALSQMAPAEAAGAAMQGAGETAVFNMPSQAGMVSSSPTIGSTLSGLGGAGAGAGAGAGMFGGAAGGSAAAGGLSGALTAAGTAPAVTASTLGTGGAALTGGLGAASGGAALGSVGATNIWNPVGWTALAALAAYGLYSSFADY